MSKPPKSEAAQGKTTSSRPINELLEIVGQKWTLRILWEMRNGPLRFRELRSQCDEISPTLLNRRLSTLKSADLIERTSDGYRLTPLGLELGAKLLELTAWARRWKDERRSGNQ